MAIHSGMGFFDLCEIVSGMMNDFRLKRSYNRILHWKFGYLIYVSKFFQKISCRLKNDRLLIGI
jgi:hypothetical protein